MDIKLIDRTLALGNLMGYARAHIEADMDLRVSTWNQGAEYLFRQIKKQCIGKTLKNIQGSV
jgi:nitrogen fixation/metabolism regulation signal transduction histidine kinase